MTTEALPQLSSPCLALRPVEPWHGVGPEEIRLDQLPLAIGAGPTCGIRLSTPGIRPLHCLLVATEGGVAVRRWAADTQLNGTSFTEALLAAGDQLTCGPAGFEVIEVEAVVGCGGDSPVPHAAALPVAWPITGQEGNYFVPVAEPQRRFVDADHTSIEQSREVLRLAENCQRLEDELAETHSLLTTLGGELLQAREAAAQQASKLTNRIDELEEILAERDNLLALLQEALAQSHESLATGFGAPTSPELGAGATTNPETELIEGKPASVAGDPAAEEPVTREEPEWTAEVATQDCGHTDFEAEDQASSFPEEPLDSESVEHSSSLLSETPVSPSADPEPEASLDWGLGSTEPEASDTEVPPAPEPFDSPAVPAPDSGKEDLWDIEKGPAEVGDSLWEAGASTEGPLFPPSPSLPSTATQDGLNESPDSEERDATFSNPSDQPLSDTEPVDSWGSDSFWPASPAAIAPTEVDEIDTNQALLWGQSPLSGSETPAPPDSLASSEMATESAPSELPNELSHEACDSTAELPEPNGSAVVAIPLEECPTAGREGGAVATGDFGMFSPGKLGEEKLLLPDLTQPKSSTPVSYIEKYRHLLDDEAVEGSPRVEPTPLPLAPSPLQGSHSEGDDDSIETYMAKMMARLRGESAAEMPSHKASSPYGVPTLPEPLAAQPGPLPLLSLDELKTAPAPERHTNMSALRDLANNSARHAIGMAHSRRLVHHARINLLLAAVATTASTYLVWSASGPKSLEMVGGLIGIGGAGLWGCRTLSFMTKARRESRGEQVTESQPCSVQEDTMLPIDVSSRPEAH